MPTLVITSATPSASVDGRYSLTVVYTHTDLSDSVMQWRIDTGDYTVFALETSPGTLLIEGLRSDGLAHGVWLNHPADGELDSEPYTAPENDAAAGIKIYFDADSESANNGKIVARITNAELVNMNYYLGVSNTVDTIKSINLGAADLTAVPPGYTELVILGDIDTSRSGVYLPDTYTFDIRSQFGAATPVAIPVAKYLFNPVQPAVAGGNIIDWGETINTVDGIVSFLDSTDYTGYTVSSREMTIVYPQITGVTTPDTIITQGSVNVSAPITYLNVTYSGTLENLIKALLTDTYDVEFEYRERFIRRKDVPISIYTDLCEVSACITTEFERLDTAACAAGGFDKMSSIDKHKFYDLAAQMSLWSIARQCNDKEQMNTVVQTIKSKLPDDCGCPDGDNAPVAYATNPYIALFSGSNLGGGAQFFKEIDGTVFQFRTLTSTTPADLSVTQNGNVIEVANIQPVVFSIVEFDENSQVTDTEGEVFIVVPTVWNGRKIRGMICKGASGAGSCTVKLFQNGSFTNANAVVSGVDATGAEVTFVSPTTLAASDIIKLEISATTGTLMGLTASLWIA